jgi:hypothetical protein
VLVVLVVLVVLIGLSWLNFFVCFIGSSSGTMMARACDDPVVFVALGGDVSTRRASLAR